VGEELLLSGFVAWVSRRRNPRSMFGCSYASKLMPLCARNTPFHLLSYSILNDKGLYRLRR